MQLKRRQRVILKALAIESGKTSALYLLILGLTVYTLLNPLSAKSLYEKVLFYPDKCKYDQQSMFNQIHQLFKVKKRDVFFRASNGKRLHAWYFKLPGATKTFLVSHGNAGNIAHRIPLAASLLAAGASVFLYDYQGYGESEGSASTEAIVEDVLSTYDYLIKQEKLLPGNIIAYGESLGCAVSCELMVRRPVKGLVLQSGFASLLSTARDKFPWLWSYPDCCFSGPKLDNLAVLQKPHPPLLLIHGANDELLPCRYSEQMYALALAPKKLVKLPNCGHNDVGIVDSQLYLSAIKDFLAEKPTLTSQSINSTWTDCGITPREYAISNNLETAFRPVSP